MTDKICPMMSGYIEHSDSDKYGSWREVEFFEKECIGEKCGLWKKHPKDGAGRCGLTS